MVLYIYIMLYYIMLCYDIYIYALYCTLKRGYKPTLNWGHRPVGWSRWLLKGFQMFFFSEKQHVWYVLQDG
jgi:hypothetical protein